MELPVIPFVCDIRFDDLADPSRGRMICFVCVRLSYCDVVNRDSDEGIACVGATANVDVVATKLDEVDDYVESRETSVGVHSRDVLGQGLLGGIVFECAGRMKDQPKRHLSLSFWDSFLMEDVATM
jgi:hypothetical protein